MGIAPRFTESVSWVTTDTSMVPRKAAPLPNISIMPNSVPECFAGIIFVKYERESACMPPWNSPTMTASTQNCHIDCMNMANAPTNVYAHMLMVMSSSFLTFPASLPNTMAEGKATICVMSSAIKSPEVSSPSAVPKEVAMSITV